MDHSESQNSFRISWGGCGDRLLLHSWRQEQVLVTQSRGQCSEGSLTPWPLAGGGPHFRSLFGLLIKPHGVAGWPPGPWLVPTGSVDAQLLRAPRRHLLAMPATGKGQQPATCVLGAAAEKTPPKPTRSWAQPPSHWACLGPVYRAACSSSAELLCVLLPFRNRGQVR